MTFKVITTGNNEFWGKKGQKKLLADSHIIHGLRNYYIEKYVEYIGKSKHHRGKHILEQRVGLPIRKIDVLEQIKQQTRAYSRILKELKFIEKKRMEILELIK